MLFSSPCYELERLAPLARLAFAAPMHVHAATGIGPGTTLHRCQRPCHLHRWPVRAGPTRSGSRARTLAPGTRPAASPLRPSTGAQARRKSPATATRYRAPSRTTSQSCSLGRTAPACTHCCGSASDTIPSQRGLQPDVSTTTPIAPTATRAPTPSPSYGLPLQCVSLL